MPTLNHELIEQQIKINQKDFDFDIREYTIEFLVQQFDPDPNGDSDIYIPEYQRDDVWTDKQKSLFIESLLIGLPIPYIFVADVDESEEQDSDGRVEIIDGAQRTRTIYQFKHNELVLQGLEKLPALEGAKFNDLPPSRQRRFNRSSVRLIELKNINEEGRRLMFDRLNTGGSPLTDMEKRLGTETSPMILFIRKLANSPQFKRLVPLPEAKLKRKEHEEYVLRFFAYKDNYLNFGHYVTEFLNDYIKDMEEIFNDDLALRYEQIFFTTLDFVERNFPNGFRKSLGSKIVSRIRFEATSVGVALALEDAPQLSTHTIDTDWAYTDETFLKMMRSDASNSRPKVKARIEFVKNKVLGRAD
ncbi:hypothetical protein J522_0230 [Acinetobacter baumannii 146457]|nr:hypothetical protein J522_0230 [Acinetobacter baumannii 146457]